MSTPAWTALEVAYRKRSPAAVVGLFLRPISMVDPRWPAPLTAWLTVHRGTSDVFLFGNSAVPMWQLISPIAMHGGTFAFARAEGGSVEWFLAIAPTGKIVFIDSDRPTELRPEAESLDQLFARDLTRLENGDIVVVGYEDKRKPLMMTRDAFELLTQAEGAFLLPRARAKTAAESLDREVEGRRFIALLLEAKLIRGPVDVAGTELSKILRSRKTHEEKAQRFMKVFGAKVLQPRVSVWVDLLTRW